MADRRPVITTTSIPAASQHLDAETVLDIKVLAELSLGTGNDLAVGEDAVHIEDDQLDFFGFVFY